MHSFAKSLAVSNNPEAREQQREDILRAIGWCDLTEHTDDMEAQKRGFDWTAETGRRVIRADHKFVKENQQRYWKDKTDPEFPIECYEHDGIKGWAIKPDDCHAIIWGIDGHSPIAMSKPYLYYLLTERRDIYDRLVVPGKRGKTVRNQHFSITIDLISLARIREHAPELISLSTVFAHAEPVVAKEFALA